MKKSITDLLQPELSRRSLLANLGAMGVGVAGAGMAGASARANAPGGDEKKYFTFGPSYNLPEDAGTLPPAVFKHPARFDLSDPHHLKLARLKVLNALNGTKTYFYTITRHIMCPPGKPPYPLLGQIELTTIFLERREGMSDNQAVIRALFTRAPLDANTFKPITSYFNPYVEREIPLKYTLFAGGGIEVDLSGDAPVDLITQSDEPHYRIGDDIAFIMYDPIASDGAFQPRMDTVTWRVNYDDLMNPEKPLIEAEHSYMALMKASVYKNWSGVADGDPAQIVTNKVGRKATSLEALPKECHDYIISQFPDRV